MPRRIRHCLECQQCRTRYLVGFSPYDNGAVLLQQWDGSCERYTLLCSCGEPFTISRSTENKLKKCRVAIHAYHRGYGSPEEIVWLGPTNSPIPKSAPPAMKRSCVH